MTEDELMDFTTGEYEEQRRIAASYPIKELDNFVTEAFDGSLQRKIFRI